jgi:hypothetical protein
MSNPVAFVSYSWSSPEHEEWVLKLARDLRSQGIDVRLDKWDLKPGHDANAFMESMVTDNSVTKVILVCDKKYAGKSNDRAGGVGTEAQIITPALYARRAQDKFVAVVREKDDHGSPYLPAYYGSRMYIDLADEAAYATQFERLVRWAWDKPVDIKPALGEMPSYLRDGDKATMLATAIPQRRAVEAIRNGREQSVPLTGEFLTTVVAELEKFRITGGQPDFDETVVRNIGDFIPYRNELIELFIAIAKYNADERLLIELHRFFEKLLAFYKQREDVSFFNEYDFDNFKFIVHELFLYCIASFVGHSQFAAAAHFVNNEYYVGDTIGSPMRPMMTYVIFRRDLAILEHRNHRLKLRRASLRFDLLKQRCEGSGVDFRHLMTTDLCLYLRSHKGDQPHLWFPDTLLLVATYPVTFEIFARAKSKGYFEKLKPLLGVEDREDLIRRVGAIEKHVDQIPKWTLQRLNPRELIQLDAIATT